MDFKIWQLLEKAADRGDQVSRGAVEADIAAGRAVFFEAANSAAVCFVDGATLRIGLAGGKLSELVALHDEIRDYGARSGFERLEIIGRGGWERALPGYSKAATLLRCEL